MLLSTMRLPTLRTLSSTTALFATLLGTLCATSAYAQKKAAFVFDEKVAKSIVACDPNLIDINFRSDMYYYAEKAKWKKSPQGSVMMPGYVLKTPITLAPNIVATDLFFTTNGVGFMVKGKHLADLAKLYGLSNKPIEGTMYAGTWVAKETPDPNKKYAPNVLVVQEPQFLEPNTTLMCESKM